MPVNAIQNNAWPQPYVPVLLSKKVKHLISFSSQVLTQNQVESDLRCSFTASGKHKHTHGLFCFPSSRNEGKPRGPGCTAGAPAKLLQNSSWKHKRTAHRGRSLEKSRPYHMLRNNRPGAPVNTNLVLGQKRRMMEYPFLRQIGSNLTQKKKRF